MKTVAVACVMLMCIALGSAAWGATDAPVSISENFDSETLDPSIWTLSLGSGQSSANFTDDGRGGKQLVLLGDRSPTVLETVRSLGSATVFVVSADVIIPQDFGDGDSLEIRCQRQPDGTVFSVTFEAARVLLGAERYGVVRTLWTAPFAGRGKPCSVSISCGIGEIRVCVTGDGGPGLTSLWHDMDIDIDVDLAGHVALAAQMQTSRNGVGIDNLVIDNNPRSVISAGQPLGRPPLCQAERRPERGGFRPIAMDGQGKMPLAGIDPYAFLLPRALNIPFWPGAQGIQTSVAEQASFDFPVGARAGAIYLLMALDYETFVRIPCGPENVSDLFTFELTYDDGQVERFAPWCVDANDYRVLPNRLCCYALKPGRDEAIRSLRVADASDRAGLRLIAITAARRSDVVPNVEPIPAPDLVPRSVRETAARAAFRPGLVSIDNGHYALGLETDHGLRLASLINKANGREYVRGGPEPVFELRSGEQILDSSRFAVTQVRREKHGDSQTVFVRLATDAIPAEVELSIRADRSCESIWSATLYNTSDQEAHWIFAFPSLRELQVANRMEDVRYYFPQRGGLLGKVPGRFLASYGGKAFTQVIDAYDCRQGGGAYLRSNDTTAVDKVMALSLGDGRYLPDFKDTSWADHPLLAPERARGLWLGIQYLYAYVPAHGSLTLPPAALGVHPGDTKVALDAYRRWADGWYRQHPQPEWLLKSVMVGAGESNNWALSQGIGGYDWWHISFYGTHGRDLFGDTEEARNALAQLKAAVREAHEHGTHYDLYYEGMLVAVDSDLGRAKGAEWQLINDKGQPYGMYGPESFYNICPAVPERHEFLRDTLARLARDAGVDGTYLDSYGSQWAHPCFNPLHHHPTPGEWTRGLADTIKTVRSGVEKVNPDFILHYEEPGCDFVTQYLDCSWSHSLWEVYSGNQAVNLPMLNFLRFIYPEFKIFEIPSYENNLSKIKASFFNGEGMWATSRLQSSHPYVRQMNRVLHENIDAFQSRDIEMLVPTVVEGVYANRFATRRKVVYTVFSNYPRTLPVRLPVEEQGRRWVDLLSHRELKSAGDHGLLVALMAHPYDVHVVAGFTPVLGISRSGRAVRVKIAGPGVRAHALQGAVVQLLAPDGGAEPVTVALAAGQTQLALSIPKGSPARWVVRLLSGGRLVDEAEVR